MAKETNGARPVALVTGASGGIGEALAHQFARGGYDLVLVARSEAKLAEVGAALAAHGAQSTLIPMDLEEPRAAAALERTVRDHGLSVEVLVNNAGYGATGGVLATDLAPQLGSVDLNVRVLTELTHRFCELMLPRGRGGVLNVASTAAFQPGPYMAVYYATKAYVLSFTEALNHEMRGTGLSATALCPGPVATGFQQRAEFDDSMRLTKVAPMMSAEAVAKAGYTGFKRGKAVVIPGATNVLMARSAPFTPRGLLLPMVEALQRKRSETHG